MVLRSREKILIAGKVKRMLSYGIVSLKSRSACLIFMVLRSREKILIAGKVKRMLSYGIVSLKSRSACFIYLCGNIVYKSSAKRGIIRPWQVIRCNT